MSASASILIVDDEEQIRKSLAMHFRLRGYTVETAANGKEALEILANTRIFVVITDLRMPVMEGIDLLRHIKQDYPLIRSIVMTGYVTLDNALSCMRLGADAFVLKPIIDFTELDEAVTRALSGVQRWVEMLGKLTKGKRLGEGGEG